VKGREKTRRGRKSESGRERRYEKRKKEEGRRNQGREMRRTRSDLLQLLECKELPLDIR
jgi:hypothetical protein